MPDSLQEKTEAPTPRRLQEARGRGQIGKSAELTGAVILLGALIALHVAAEDMVMRMVQVMRRMLGASADEMMNVGMMGTAIAGTFEEMARMVIPIMIVVTVLALLTSFLQVGWLITFETIKPSIDKLNPLSGIKRMFSGQAMMNLVMGVFKMCILSGIAYWTLRDKVDLLAYASDLPHLGLVVLTGELMFSLGLRLAIALILLALIDLVYQKYKTIKQLRMTKEEVREEMKRMDGDPQVKRRRREVQLQLSMQRLQASVPHADVVVTNPTELAIAIQYDGDEMDAPKVVAKGADYMAMRIRQLAIMHGIPIVERKPLARALYREVEVGQEIPPQFYKAVAEILAYVYELAGKGNKRPVANAG